MPLIERLLVLVLCHLVGDYPLQSSFLATAKAETTPRGIYHLAVHSFLYGLPFLCYFDYSWRIWVLIVAHFITDYSKSRNRIQYGSDQAIHYITLTIFLIGG